MTTKIETQFERELEVFRTEVEATTLFFYAHLTINAVAGDNDKIFRLLNTAALFWQTNLSALQTSMFVTLGRIFDQKSKHNVDRLLRIAQNNPQIFAKSALGSRKQGKNPNPPDWLSDYLKRAYIPKPADFRRMRIHVKNGRKLYESKYRDLRHRVFAHKELSDPEEISALFAKTNIRELQLMLTSLLAVYEALWQLFYNGRRLVLRRGRYSLRRMRQTASPNGRASPRERLVREVEGFLVNASRISQKKR